MFGRQDLRTLSMDRPSRTPDFVCLVHQLRDQVKAKARVAKKKKLAICLSGARITRVFSIAYWKSSSVTDNTETLKP